MLLEELVSVHCGEAASLPHSTWVAMGCQHWGFRWAVLPGCHGFGVCSAFVLLPLSAPGAVQLQDSGIKPPWGSVPHPKTPAAAHESAGYPDVHCAPKVLPAWSQGCPTAQGLIPSPGPP